MMSWTLEMAHLRQALHARESAFSILAEHIELLERCANGTWDQAPLPMSELSESKLFPRVPRKTLTLNHCWNSAVDVLAECSRLTLSVKQTVAEHNQLVRESVRCSENTRSQVDDLCDMVCQVVEGRQGWWMESLQDKGSGGGPQQASVSADSVYLRLGENKFKGNWSLQVNGHVTSGSLEEMTGGASEGLPDWRGGGMHTAGWSCVDTASTQRGLSEMMHTAWTHRGHSEMVQEPMLIHRASLAAEPSDELGRQVSLLSRRDSRQSTIQQLLEDCTLHDPKTQETLFIF